ncbi:MAG: Rpn family recombination-promoting nuclease/putative transposase [Aphanocapsa sp. GSE-SYN-MK-11-07L]|jgi:predicted transposase/invertase (TIGR01784 family)|nr:Rpn family recombination-promoting nuclease/putative transposase [Aphanocapsa sp. GSE-SYN-MK-11-07L]
MRRDPIFYRMFQRSPELLFDLIGTRPDNASDYRFDAVAVKEPKFEIDGVFLPPELQQGVVYFCEVQFQKDEELYERLFGESLLYFYRNSAKFSDWQAVVIYPSRTIEQSKVYPHRSLLNGEQVHRVYLDELGDVQSLPVPVAATVLTIIDPAEAPAVARDLLARTQQEFSAKEQKDMVDIVTSIMVYKFANLSRSEIKAMLGLDLTKEPRAIQEAKQEGREEGREEGRQEERVLALQRERSLILRQLIRKIGGLDELMRDRVRALSVEHLEELGEALLEFEAIADLEAWLSKLE